MGSEQRPFAVPTLKMPRCELDIVIFERDACEVRKPHDNLLLIMLRMEEFNIYQVLIDNGSLADIMYLPAFQQMKLGKERLRPLLPHW